jgi:hypothetical protein
MKREEPQSLPNWSTTQKRGRFDPRPGDVLSMNVSVREVEATHASSSNFPDIPLEWVGLGEVVRQGFAGHVMLGPFRHANPTPMVHRTPRMAGVGCARSMAVMRRNCGPMLGWICGVESALPMLRELGGQG